MIYIALGVVLYIVIGLVFGTVVYRGLGKPKMTDDNMLLVNCAAILWPGTLVIYIMAGLGSLMFHSFRTLSMWYDERMCEDDEQGKL